MAIDLQAKLLRVLETGEFLRIGFLLLAVPNIVMEASGNPEITKMGINSSLGAISSSLSSWLCSSAA